MATAEQQPDRPVIAMQAPFSSQDVLAPAGQAANKWAQLELMAGRSVDDAKQAPALSGLALSGIVGIGASAGGIEALHQFFAQMPADEGLAFVVVLHTAPDRKSLLPEILSHWTKMNVQTVAPDMLLKPNCVYVIPPGFTGKFLNGRLSLDPVAETQPHLANAIDIFFNALADEARSQAVGIILSGTGHDGALGLKAIRAAGGTTIAQGRNGTSPQYSGMPDSAIATGAVDLVLPVEEIPALLHGFSRAALHRESPAPPPETDMQQIRLQICEILQQRVNHDFSQYKENTFLRRVGRRMQILGLSSYHAYIERLKSDQQEATLLFRDLLIGVTSFFRDSETFDLLRSSVLPKVFRDKGPNDTIRLWVAGCATGEEAYSLAMLLCEYAGALESPPKLQIFATDIDDVAIAAARAGRYPAVLVAGMPQDRLTRFFNQTNQGYIVTKEIRDICTFSAHSLIRDPPFSRADMVSCRNLLIYLDNEAQARVIPTFHYALVPGGILLLGSSETVSRYEDLFATIDKKHRIFQRRDTPGHLPQLPIRTALNMTGQDNKPITAMKPKSGDPLPQAIGRAKARVLEHYATPFVLVTAAGDVTYYSNHIGEFLEPPQGVPTKSVFEMARPAVRLSLRAALCRAVETGDRVEQRVLAVEAADGTVHSPSATLIIETIGLNEPERFYLIIFAKDPAFADGAAWEVNHQTAEELSVSMALERDNRDLREQLQSIKEEHETALEELRSSNEEMHSVNEEMQSSNEELETSREEIQSINEEMSTVNAQLSTKLDELDRANSDLRNLFESTRVATIFLDKHLIIRGFTPEVTNIYNLIPSDQGRPLTDIVSKLRYRTLADDAAEVAHTRAPLERRLSRDDGTIHYLMRILPYRSPDSSIDGSLITFVEVTGLVRAEQHQRLLIDELNHRVKNMLTVVISLASQTLRHAGSLSSFASVFLGRVHALSTAYELLSNRSWTTVSLQDLLLEELKPFMAENRANIRLSGPDVPLDSRSALMIGMAVHELSTNAVKFGALSVPEGDVAVAWTVVAENDAPWFRLDWKECNGPAVEKPQRPGFGLALIERGISHDLGGHTNIEFLRTGVHATLQAPLQRMLPDDGAPA